jgi:hypothetical protein
MSYIRKEKGSRKAENFTEYTRFPYREKRIDHISTNYYSSTMQQPRIKRNEDRAYVS